jgi:acetyl-CoA carboxylase carboxyltransferase component
MCDALVMVEPHAALSIASTAAVRQYIGEVPDPGALGGASMHCTVSGLGDARVQSEAEAFTWIRRYLSFMPTPRGDRPEPCAPLPPAATGRSIEEIVPADSERPFAMAAVIQELVDRHSLHELKPLFAREVITAFARIEGRPVGLVANDSAHRGGVLFGDTCDKAARFITLCEAFAVPLVFLVDVPGFMSGTRAEQDGILRHAARLFTVLADATVPRITVVVRKAHTAGLYAMCGPAFDPTAFLALPTASLAVWGERAAITQAAPFTQTIPDPTEAARFQDQVRMRHRTTNSVRALADRVLLEVIESLPALRAQLAVRLARTPAVRRAARRRRLRLTLF